MQNQISLVARASLVVLAACGSENPQRHLDAAVPATDASPDAPPDAPPDASCIRTLLTGGTDVAAQGWTVISMNTATVTNGADYVQLQTSTATSANVGGQLLLSYPNAVTPNAPFELEVVMLVQAVNTHNQFDAGAAILGSLTGSVGNQVDRGQMIYLDAAALGWADNTQSSAATITDGAYHTYVLAVDAAKNATVTMDGTTVLTRANFTTTGTIAIGDQTNDPNVDGTTRIKSVRLLCP